MQYQVYHAKNPTFGMSRQSFPEDYELVADVECENLEHVFEITNHIDHSWYDNSEVIKFYHTHARSTSVGDVVVDADGKQWLCEMNSWTHINPPLTQNTLYNLGEMYSKN